MSDMIPTTGGDIRPVERLIVLDLDGVICEETGAYDDYEDRRVMVGVRMLLSGLYEDGYKITVHTARHSTDFWPTVRWFQRQGLDAFVERIIFDKPRGVIYVDDRAVNSITFLTSREGAL